MNHLVQRRKQRSDRGDGGTLARRGPDDMGLAMPAVGRQLDRVFDRLWRAFDPDPLSTLDDLTTQLADWPAIDVAEDDNAVNIRVDLPGIDPDEIDIQVSGNVLTISGTRRDEWSDNDRGVRVRERVVGSFTRTVTLPSYVDPDRIDATYDRGTLVITIPKIAGQGPRRVQVSSSGQLPGGSQGQSAAPGQAASQGQSASPGQSAAQARSPSQGQGGGRP